MPSSNADIERDIGAVIWIKSQTNLLKGLMAGDLIAYPTSPIRAKALSVGGPTLKVFLWGLLITASR